jgi:vacuolar-type H+-ATPase subunit I/STV1
MQRLTNSTPTRASEWLLLVALLACYPLSATLPDGWAREGGILENAQVLVLLAGAVAGCAAYLRLRPDRLGVLALWAAPVWLLLAGRELSWGRVWLPVHDGQLPNGVAMNGVLWLQAGVKPGAIVLALGLLYSVWRYRIHTIVRSAFARRMPWLCLAIGLVAAIGSTCAEGHMSCSFGFAAARAALLEELVELVAYVALFMVQDSVLREAPAPAVLGIGSQAG